MKPQNQIKERPIPLKTWEVQAILSGNKTQTRRVLKTQPEWMSSCGDIALLYLHDFEYYIGEKPFVCPYGEPGDILWVRETLAANALGGAIYKADGSPVLCESETLEAGGYFDMDSLTRGKRNHISSIHMPKEAARIWLRVKDVRVERVQDISEEDAIAEGVDAPFEHRAFFADLWRSINGAESWNGNPFVWVVEYEVLSTTGKPKN